MKALNQVRKYGRRVVQAGAVGGLSLVSGMALAAVDISAETASAKTDIATAGGLIVGVVVAIAVIAWIRRVIH